MNFRLAISAFPRAGDPARARILAALAEATGLSPALLESRLSASPAWLFDVPDRDEAEAWRALLGRQRGVQIAALPSRGAPADSYAEALPRARLALGMDPARARAAAPPEAPRARGITAPVDLGEPDPAAPVERASTPGSGRRGITAPVDFLSADALGDPSDPPPVVQGLSEMIEPERPAEPRRRPTLDDGDLELARRERLRGPAPTVAPPGLARRAIEVRVSTGRRVFGPLLRLLIPAALIGGGVLLWRYLDRPVVNKPALADIELLDEGRPPLEPLRYTPVEDGERFRVALGLEHRVASNQVDARPRIDTIGGSARLERLDGGEDWFDYKPTGREARRGPIAPGPVRVLDVGHTGDLPPPFLPDVAPDDLPAMRGFARLVRPPYVLLPARPVGPGARWRYRLGADQSPLGLETVVEVELLGRDGRRLELALKKTVPATRDPGDGPVAYQRIGPFFVRYDPPLRVFDFAGVGEGRATIDLDRMTPVALDVAVQFAARIEARTDFGVQLIEYSPVIALEIRED